MNEHHRRIKFLLPLFAATLLLFSLPLRSSGQQYQGQSSEVYLTFQYQGIVGVYVTAYYDGDTFYLPVIELFNVLKIQKQVEPGALTISGTYLGEKSYYFNFQSGNPKARVGDKEIKLHADDYMIKEVDFFVRPYLFEELFGLKFSVDYNNLTLQLETTDKMPVVAQYERDQKRKKLDRSETFFSKNYYPLKYDRDYSTLDGAFLDYSISSIYSESSQILTTNNAIGAELLGGDVEGNFFGAFSAQQQSFTTNNLRWRHVRRNNNFFSSIIAGQTTSEGIASRAIAGIKISNKPVEPRKLFDRFVIDGQTVPQSEVELYLNNRLVDYQSADAGGTYRFVVPLTYGNTNYSVRIFTPSGRSIEENSRIQIPFEYLPPGEIDYTASFGKLENPIFGTDKQGYQGSATVSTGLTKWLTAQASTEYLSDFHSDIPSFTGTLNGRLFSRYLVSASANSENFYRFMSSVVYSSGTSWNLSYDYNPGNSQLYNIGGNEQQARLNIFTPFRIGNVPLNLRLFSSLLKNGSSELIRYRSDLNTRFGRLNIRLGYQDQQITPLSLQPTSSSRITNSYTYTVGRKRNIPDFFQSMFIRGRFSYLPELNELEEIEFQLSKDLFETSRTQLTFNHNFRGNISAVSLNFTLDFNKIRSNSTVRATDSQFSFNQSFRGSIGYDSYANQLILNNRQQTGQSGAAVRLFIDNNNDGSYQNSIDDIINDPAVRVDRAGGRTEVKNGVNYIDQLLPYYRYNIEINRSALRNPLLIPKVENFSIVTDPNQFKPIEIPFYLSGVIDGRVQKILPDSTKKGVAGLTLHLKQKNGDFSKEIRTFSDGSFYAYEIPPGEYSLIADSTQLEILGTVSNSHSKNFEVKALAQGDFITGLNFDLTIASQENEQFAERKTSSKKTTLFDLFNNTNTAYEVQLARFDREESARHAARQAQLLFKEPFRIKFNRQTKQYVLRSYPTDNRSMALDKLMDIQQSPFQNAALVVTRSKEALPVPQQTKNKTAYSIQLGAFSMLEKALTFMKKAQKELQEDIEITFDESMELYKITIQDLSEREQAIAQLNQIKASSPFKDSFIIQLSRPVTSSANTVEINQSYNYNLFVKGVTPQTQQAYIAAGTGDSDVEINQSLKKDLLIFEDIQSWKNALNLQQKLATISTSGQRIIVLIERKE